MLTNDEKLEVLTNLAVELNQIGDLDILMEKILTMAREFVNARAGSIYIREDDKLHFSYTQNLDLQAKLPQGEKLIYLTFSLPIDQNSIAGFTASTGQILNIPDVYQLDSSLPYHFGRGFDEASGFRTRSMLTIPLVTTRQDVIGVLQIINACNETFEIMPFSEVDEKMMLHFASSATVALERARMTRSMILRTIRMAEMRDPKETGAHVNRVASYSIEIYERWARKQGKSQEDIDKVRDVFRMAAMLHDVGKVAISDTILKKPARFTPEEFEVMKMHTVMGAQLFTEKQSDFDDAAGVVALTHHERWDGKGYPGYVDLVTSQPLPGYTTPEGKAKGKAGDEIPLLGRIVAIADVYDALCSRRIYKPAWDEQEALDMIQQGAGGQFDAELVDIFFSVLDQIRSIRERYPDKMEQAPKQAAPGTPKE